MGLGAFKWYWQRQTIDFGHDQASKYSCLIFDNRGMGESDKPVVRYSTSEMARDTFELLDHLGWIGERSVHLIGISMGGMIIQEMVRARGWSVVGGANVEPGLSRTRKNSQSFTGINSGTADKHYRTYRKAVSRADRFVNM